MSENNVDAVERIVSELGELPAAPAILRKALELTSNIQSNIQDISRSISADQTLAARVIKLSNSPLYGRAREILSLNEAIKVLGFNQVKSIIVTATTSELFQSGPTARIARVLWEHSLATALGARLVARRFTGVDPEEAYLCGLLHDIGKLVMLIKAPEQYGRVIAIAKQTKLPFINVEGKEFGFNHVQVGRALLEHWGFPKHLISQIGAHHTIKLDVRETEASLARIVAIADSVAKYIGASFFQPYEFSGEAVVFVGSKLVEEAELITLRVDVEEQYNHEMNTYYR